MKSVGGWACCMAGACPAVCAVQTALVSGEQKICLCHVQHKSNLSFMFEDLCGESLAFVFCTRGNFPVAGCASHGTVTITVPLLLKRNWLIWLSDHTFLSEFLSPVAGIESAGSHINFLSCHHLQQFICSSSFPLKLFWTETTLSSLQFIHWGSQLGRLSDWCQGGRGYGIFLRTFSSCHLSVGSTQRNLDCVAFLKLFFFPLDCCQDMQSVSVSVPVRQHLRHGKMPPTLTHYFTC